MNKTKLALTIVCVAFAGNCERMTERLPLSHNKHDGWSHESFDVVIYRFSKILYKKTICLKP